MEITNNKELVPLQHYLEMFASADPLEMSRKTAVPYDEETKQFSLTFLGRTYRIGWPEFTIEAADDIQVYSPLLNTNQAKILALRYLTECSFVSPSGTMMTYRELPWGELYFRQFSGRCLSRLAFSYGSRIAQFREKMEKLGAKKLSQSDAGYEIDIFPGFTVQFLLWESDEEFPPSSQILFSDNFAVSFHGEDPVVVSEIIISALKQL